MTCPNREKLEKQIETLKKELISKDEKLIKRREQAQRLCSSCASYTKSLRSNLSHYKSELKREKQK